MSDIRDRLTLQPPATTKVAEAMDFYRQAIISLGEEIEGGLPDCREKSLALTNLEQVHLWTIATIARNQEYFSPVLAESEGTS